MGIEKLSDESRTFLEENPYSQVLNEVTLYIKDNDAFRVYCYLLSKTKNWKVIKKWVLEQCQIGERKGKQIFSYLFRCGLLKYSEIRKSNGQFSGSDILVTNGKNFNKDEPFLAVGAETARAENGTCGNVGTTKERNKLNKDETKEFTNREREDIKQYVNELENEHPLSDQSFKTLENQNLCHQKNLNIDFELKKFRNYYQNRNISVGMFENWLIRANKIQSNAKNDKNGGINLDEYIKRLMKDTGMSEDEAREYYRSRGFA